MSGAIKSEVLELMFDGGPVGLSGAASEIFYVKAGHRTILAYIHLRMSWATGVETLLSCRL